MGSKVIHSCLSQLRTVKLGRWCVLWRQRGGNKEMRSGKRATLTTPRCETAAVLAGPGNLLCRVTGAPINRPETAQRQARLQAGGNGVMRKRGGAPARADTTSILPGSEASAPPDPLAARTIVQAI